MLSLFRRKWQRPRFHKISQGKWTDPAGQSLWSLRTLSIRHDRGAVFRRTWTGKVQMAKPFHCPKCPKSLSYLSYSNSDSNSHDLTAIDLPAWPTSARSRPKQLQAQGTDHPWVAPSLGVTSSYWQLLGGARNWELSSDLCSFPSPRKREHQTKGLSARPDQDLAAESSTVSKSWELESLCLRE